MGYKNKSYRLDLKQQIKNKFEKMLKEGENTSKKEAIADKTAREKIFAYNTYQTYRKHCNYFADYIREKHPKCTTLESAKKYVNEWLEWRINYYKNNKGYKLSNWTIRLEHQALVKLYDKRPSDPDYFVCPKRRREDIKRSRVDCVRDKHFSVTNNDELIKFCRGTGLRRSEVAGIKGDCLYTKDKLIEILSKTTNETKIEIINDALRFTHQNYFIFVKGKGGKYRLAPIRGKNEKQIVERIVNTPKDQKVWQYVNTNADIHSYRSDYGTALYKEYARPIDQIPYDKRNKLGIKYQSQVYHCRKDDKGKKMDKQAMLIASKALGHNRIEVIANNYIRGL